MKSELLFVNNIFQASILLWLSCILSCEHGYGWHIHSMKPPTDDSVKSPCNSEWNYSVLFKTWFLVIGEESFRLKSAVCAFVDLYVHSMHIDLQLHNISTKSLIARCNIKGPNGILGIFRHLERQSTLNVDCKTCSSLRYKYSKFNVL